MNAPTTFNARYHFAQFHDGRADDLKSQATGPLTNPIEMGNTLTNVVKTVKKNNFYSVRFQQLYKDGITMDNILDAIAQFENALVTLSRFDEYLQGDKKALRDVEVQGLELFKSYGCIACHNGINIGGNLFQKLGIMKEYEGNSLGRYNVTKEEKDKKYFRVPTLRNINWTHSYLHDGSIDQLDKCVQFMGEYQMGIKIPQEDVQKIEFFLQSLTGKIPNVIEN
ncbi:MAG: cytochrome c peroxidase [Sulfurimonas sp.]|nr:cytochrome c peroxidase [Sulfurimonas sp.]